MLLNWENSRFACPKLEWPLKGESIDSELRYNITAIVLQDISLVNGKYHQHRGNFLR